MPPITTWVSHYSYITKIRPFDKQECLRDAKLIENVSMIYFHIQFAKTVGDPRQEKTGVLPMRKQRRRSATLFSLHG